MRAGKRRHLITIERAPAVDAEGALPSDGWTTVTTVWASVSPISGMRASYLQLERTRQDFADVTHEIHMNYPFAAIDYSMRIRWGTRIFKIVSKLDVDERNRELHLDCMEIVSNA